uniref:DDRGK domain containing 1 n=1 Tax=Chelydra serpentina TaxID=8475 RepID=A0A8C3S3B7_CHESE
RLLKIMPLICLLVLAGFYMFSLKGRRGGTVDSIKEDDEDEAAEFQSSGKIGAKKQRKLEEKQARKAQREVSPFIFLQEEEQKKAKEEKEQREHEEYLKLKEGFVVEEEGVEEAMTEEEVRCAVTAARIPGFPPSFLRLNRFRCLNCPDCILSPSLLTPDHICLLGVIDDRGKFIYITPEEMTAVAQFIKQRGRVSIAELAQASNSLINLQPESRAATQSTA